MDASIQDGRVRVHMSDDFVQLLLAEYNAPEAKVARAQEHFQAKDRAWTDAKDRDTEMKWIECHQCNEMNWCMLDCEGKVDGNGNDIEYICESCDEDNLWDLMSD